MRAFKYFGYKNNEFIDFEEFIVTLGKLHSFLDRHLILIFFIHQMVIVFLMA